LQNIDNALIEFMGAENQQDDITIIGKAPTCDIQIAATGISRQHCQIANLGKSLVVHDLNSRNGTFVNKERIADWVDRNPILVTALNPVIGYELGATIAKKAFKENRKVKEVAQAESGLSKQKLDQLLNPKKLTQGGISK